MPPSKLEPLDVELMEAAVVALLGMAPSCQFCHHFPVTIATEVVTALPASLHQCGGDAEGVLLGVGHHHSGPPLRPPQAQSQHTWAMCRPGSCLQQWRPALQHG